MSVTFKQINASPVTPKDDAIENDIMLGRSGIMKGCLLTYLGTNQVSITAGRGIMKGRTFIVSAETISCAMPTSGSMLGRIYIQGDLSNTTPAAIKTVVGATLPALIQNPNFNEENGIYEIELATYTASATVISNLTQTYSYMEDAETVINNLKTQLGGIIFLKLTQAQYDAIITKDPNTFYLIAE